MGKFSPLLNLSLFGAFLLSGCMSNRLGDPFITRYHEDGRAKPLAAIPLMIDTTTSDVPWSIAEELTTGINQAVGALNKIYLKQGDEYAIAENPFDKGLTWTKEEFAGQQFVVFLELAEHEVVPLSKSKVEGEATGSYLNMGVRVRVVDLRDSTPRIVLQEMIRESYYIPKSFFPPDYQIIFWGTDEYHKTPMGIAHGRLCHEIASRVADYILLAQSR
jgi:hypothetical protein